MSGCFNGLGGKSLGGNKLLHYPPLTNEAKEGIF